MNTKRIVIYSIAGVIALVFVAGLFLPSIGWDGTVYREIEVRVLDDDSHRALSGAEVSILRELESQIMATITNQNDKEVFLQSQTGFGITDSNGVAIVARHFGAGGSSMGPIRTGRFLASGPLTVQADGYQTFEGLIQNSLGQKRYPLSQKDLTVTIYMKKASNQSMHHTN